jgi:putative solute:sodium symporter small subunit
MYVVRGRSPSIAERRGAGPDQRRNIEQGGPMSDPRSLPAEERARQYWAENQRLIITLLVIWFAVSYLPVLFINQLNTIVIGGFPLGYYIGAQGSLIVFVIEIFYYAFAMNRLDAKYGLGDRDR